jgi:hypothetical protein
MGGEQAVMGGEQAPVGPGDRHGSHPSP